MTFDTIELLAVLTVVLAGILAGSELTSWAVIHPTLWKLAHVAQVQAERLIYKRFAGIDAPLMTATVTVSFIFASQLQDAPGRMALAGATTFAAMLAITLLGNMPINMKVFKWDEDEGDPEEWRRLRRRWDRLHSVRIVLDTTGFVLIAGAAITA